ncbi:hypothetical protein FNV43_RR03425 [Rhamnella rubrinervis]|uniref:Pentatricopeptide repeat-containing protein n=1 Tax=Rhamnella rubrinervis TaxID=2594499 RepID=A0A8K0MNV8_9ROSA|nr:hypothetical protein FNV43_RR03425 [Rhamnella rubrinervis]
MWFTFGLASHVVMVFLSLELISALNGVKIKLVDAAFPLLKGIVATTDVVEACTGVNIAVMSGKGVLVKAVGAVDASADTAFEVVLNLEQHQRKTNDYLSLRNAKKLLSKLHGNLKFCLESLGICGALQVGVFTSLALRFNFPPVFSRSLMASRIFGSGDDCNVRRLLYLNLQVLSSKKILLTPFNLYTSYLQMLLLSMNCVQLKHLSSAIRSISNHRPVFKTTVNLSVLETLSQKCRDFKEFKQILSQMIFTGFIKDTFAAKRLLQFSTRDLPFIHVDYSYQIFNFIENSDASIYNIMLMAYVRRNYPHRAIHFYKLMLYRNVGPNVYTYPFLAEACAIRESYFEGKQMHNHVLKLGFDSDVDVRSTFVDMYADCYMTDEAFKVFEEGPVMVSFVWYSLLEGFFRWGDVESADYIYNLMPEKDTIASAFMIYNYWCWGEYEKHKQLINEIPKNDTVSLSAIVYKFQAEYYGKYEEAFEIFKEMHANGIRIDELVVDAVLLCCKNLSDMCVDVEMTGKLIHSLVVKIGIECDVKLQNRLICMYSKSGQILSAQNLFNAARWLDQITWYYMLVGYAECGLDENVKALFESMPRKIRSSCRVRMIIYFGQNGCFSESLALFHKMVRSGISQDDGTWYKIIMLLPRGFGALDLGKCIHAYLIKNGYDLKHGGTCSALSHLYNKQPDKRDFE